MTNNRNYYVNTTSSNHSDRTRYGGVIYLSDFEIDYRVDNHNISSIADRIIRDMRFDEQCRKNLEHKEKHGRVAYSWNRKEN